MVLTMDETAIRKGIADGLAEYFESIETFNWVGQKMAALMEASLAEQRRVARLIERDIVEREREARREQALKELEIGIDANIADTSIAPTPEQLKKGRFIRRKVAGEQWQDRAVDGYRRLQIMQITYLASRGVLNEKTYAACKWYRERYEAAQMEPSAPVAQYGETVRGDPIYGPLPRTEWAAEARTDIRWARGFIPDHLLPIFDLIVVKDDTIENLARNLHRGTRYVKASLLVAAWKLYEGIHHRLEKKY